MGRIFTAFLFIIIPFAKLFADDSSLLPCFQWNGDSSTCNSQLGCHYVSGDYEGCIACDAGDGVDQPGQFGSGCESNCNDPFVGAGPDFPFGHRYTLAGNSAARGARTKYECYKKLDTAGNDDTPQQGHGYKCRDSADSDVDGCREYYRESGTYVSCNGDAGKDSDGDLIPPPNDTGYHMEESGCYKNTRKCSKFIISSGYQNQCITSDSSHQNRTISSDIELTWNVSTHQWQNNQICKCRVEGDFEEDHCNGFKEFYNTGMVNSSTVSAQLIFRNNSSYGATTHCSGCFAGYYANWDTGGSFNCVPAPQGYYSTGCGTKWTDDNPTESSIPDCTRYSGILKPCYAGMTSDSGADSVQDCHYTSQTQFCDAWGCTSYSNLVGSNADNWWWYMQSGTTTGGSVDTSIDENHPIINDPSFE